MAERLAALSPSARRLVALLVLPLVLLAGCLAVLLPIQQAWQSQQRWREETKQLLAQSARAPALRAALEQQGKAVRASPLRSKLYQTSGAMNPAALLQGDIEVMMSTLQAGGRTLAPMPVSESGTLLRYGVRVTASLRINQLEELLYAVAQHPRLLRVEQLTVVAPQVQLPEENPPLAVTLDIYGFALPEVSPTVVAVTAAAGVAP